MKWHYSFTFICHLKPKFFKIRFAPSAHSKRTGVRFGWSEFCLCGLISFLYNYLLLYTCAQTSSWSWQLRAHKIVQNMQMKIRMHHVFNDYSQTYIMQNFQRNCFPNPPGHLLWQTLTCNFIRINYMRRQCNSRCWKEICLWRAWINYH